MAFCHNLRSVHPANVRIAIVRGQLQPAPVDHDPTPRGDWAEADNVEPAYVRVYAG